MALTKNNLWFSLLHERFYKGPEENYPDVSRNKGISDLEKNSELILNELQNYLKQFAFEDQFNVTMVEKPKTWKVRSLRVWGVEMFEIQKCFPNTMNLLNQVDGVINIGFNLLEPGAKIKPHCGDTNAVIRCHLGLVIPEQTNRCAIKVNGETRYWLQNKIISFTDAYEHEAWNHTDNRRIILLFDILKPSFITKKNRICGVVITSLYLQRLGNVFPKFYQINPKWLSPITYSLSFIMKFLIPIRNRLKRG